jgi:hypothetical protein
MKLPSWVPDSVLRLSFSRFTIIEELEKALEIINLGVK